MRQSITTRVLLATAFVTALAALAPTAAMARNSAMAAVGARAASAVTKAMASRTRLVMDWRMGFSLNMDGWVNIAPERPATIYSMHKLCQGWFPNEIKPFPRFSRFCPHELGRIPHIGWGIYPDFQPDVSHPAAPA